MSHSKKRLVSALLSLFLVFSTVAPRPAFAVLGLVAPLIVAGGAAIGSSSASSLATAATGLAIGAGLGYLFKDSISDTLGKLGKSGSNTPTAIPPGDSAPLAKPSQWPDPNTPANSMPRMEVWHANGQIYGSQSEAFDVYTSSQGCLQPTYDYQYGVIRCHRAVTGETFSIALSGPNFFVSYTCPYNYNYNGSTCDLWVPGKDAAKWPNDGVSQKAAAGDAGYPRDPDTSPPLPGNNPSTGTVLEETGQDSSGNIVSHAVVTTPNGGRKIVEAIAPPGATFGDSAQVTTIVTDTNGNVVSSSVENKTIPASVGGVTSLVTNVTVPATNQGTIAFPADYAKDGTVAASNTLLDTIKGSIAAIKDWVFGAMPATTILDTSAATTTQAADHVADQFSTPNVVGDHGFRWSWLPEVPTAGCSAFSFQVGILGTFNLDPCPTLEKIRDLFGYVLYILTGYALFNILTRKPS